MKKAILMVLLCLFAGAFFSFLMDEDDQRKGKPVDRRVAVERIMEAFNLRFHKDNAQTSIIFQLVAGDSVKFECEDCPALMPSADEPKGKLGIAMQSLDGTVPIESNQFGKWLKLKSTNGKFGLVFSRDGLGEKILNIRSLRIWRKTRKPAMDEQGVQTSIVDINNIYIDRFSKENSTNQTTFYFKLKSEDKILVGIKGVNGAVPENIVCQVFKDKEEFDKTPIATGVPIDVPKVDGGADRFAFEFSHISEDIKGTNIYHLDIWRTPLRSTAFLEEPVVDTTDTMMTPADSILRASENNDLFLEYLAKLAGGPNFQCVTPEGELTGTINGTLMLGMTKKSKFCIDLPLSDECVASEECIGCDTLMAYWIGAGQDLINRYRFADSTRKLATTKGLLESYARSKKYRGMQGGNIFPSSQYGEDIYYVIVDQASKSQFLNSELDETAWIGDGITTFSPGMFVSSSQYMLKFNPGRPLALCVCNNNSVSTVPFLFKYQQYLTEPEKKDSTDTPEEEEGIYEILEEETEPVKPPVAKKQGGSK